MIPLFERILLLHYRVNHEFVTSSFFLWNTLLHHLISLCHWFLRSFPKHFLPPSLLQRLIEIAEERREGTGEGERLQLTPPNCLLYEEISNGKPSLIPWVSRAWLWQLPIRDGFLQSAVAIFTVIYNNAKKGASWGKICKGLSLKLTKKYTS